MVHAPRRLNLHPSTSSLLAPQVYQPTGRHLAAIKGMMAFMALVTALAIVGAFRGLIVSWSQGFELFAN